MNFGLWTFQELPPFLVPQLAQVDVSVTSKPQDVEPTLWQAQLVIALATSIYQVRQSTWMLTWYILDPQMHISLNFNSEFETFVNSLAPGRYGMQFWMLNILCATPIRWMPQDLSGDRSTLVQVVAWCQQAPSHYLNRCWQRSMTLYGVIEP